MECFFLNPSDEWNRRDSIVRNVCSQYRVDVTSSNKIEQLFKRIQDIVLLEVPIKPEFMWF